MNRYTVTALSFLAILIFTGFLWQQVNSLKQTVHKLETDRRAPALHLLMGYMQRYHHKLLYAVQAENKELAGFYLHELEELSEDINEHIDEYDGHPVGRLTTTMLLPVIEETEATLDENNWPAVRNQVSIITQACNNCHSATDHGYIRIQHQPEQNPFNQTFE